MTIANCKYIKLANSYVMRNRYEKLLVHYYTKKTTHNLYKTKY